MGSDESDNGIGLCGWLLTAISWGLVMVTLPFSLCVCFKVVQEYERAVIFRLGRLLSGGSRGPGIFFVLPCIESYQKVDLRTITLGVPPQEVRQKSFFVNLFFQSSYLLVRLLLLLLYTVTTTTTTTYYFNACILFSFSISSFPSSFQFILV